MCAANRAMLQTMPSPADSKVLSAMLEECLAGSGCAASLPIPPTISTPDSDRSATPAAPESPQKAAPSQATAAPQRDTQQHPAQPAAAPENLPVDATSS